MTKRLKFGKQRWDDLKGIYQSWWDGELKRPLVTLARPDRDPGRPEPDLPDYHFTARYDLSVSADDIVDRWDWGLSRMIWLCDGFPTCFPNFGPGVLAAMLGAELHCDDNTVWFHPTKIKEAKDLSLDGFSEENMWFRRVRDIYRTAEERWHGDVQVGMTDLGGAVDVVSTFRPSENLLLDLYDCPEEIRRLTREAHEMWFAAFGLLSKAIPSNPGFTAWTAILSPDPYYMLQCDFAYMIGPDMFDEFVKPELEAACGKLANPFYHLDGEGQLPHLDSLLSIEKLKGVQWIPGEGSPRCTEWPEVYRKIRKAGKLIQLFGNLDTLDVVATQLGSAEGIILVGGGDYSDADIEEFLRKWS